MLTSASSPLAPRGPHPLLTRDLETLPIIFLDAPVLARGADELDAVGPSRASAALVSPASASVGLVARRRGQLPTHMLYTSCFFVSAIVL